MWSSLFLDDEKPCPTHRLCWTNPGYMNPFSGHAYWVSPCLGYNGLDHLFLWIELGNHAFRSEILSDCDMIHFHVSRITYIPLILHYAPWRLEIWMSEDWKLFILYTSCSLFSIFRGDCAVILGAWVCLSLYM